VATEDLITTRFWDIMKAYLASLIVLFPVFIWAFWITSLDKQYYSANLDHFIGISRILGDILLISLVISFILWALGRNKLVKSAKKREMLKHIFPSLMGISIFSGTLTLFVITIISTPRGLSASQTASGIKFTILIPAIKTLHNYLESLLI